METLAAIKKRRSIRQYQPQPVEDEKVMAVLEAASCAPSAVNGQPWGFIVVRELEIRQRLSELILGAHRTVFSQASTQPVSGSELDQRMHDVYASLPQAPVYVVVCLHRKRAYVKQEFDQGAYLFDVESVAAAMENLLLAAADQGLGTCWMGAPLFAEADIKGLMGIPDDVTIFGVTPLGYPAENPGPRPRDPLPTIVHFDRWQQRAHDSSVESYDTLLGAAPQAAATPQTVEALLARGQESFTSGRLDEALGHFSAAIAADPGSASAYRDRGSVYYTKGDQKAAAQDYTRAMELQPQDSGVYYFRGLAHQAMGRLNEAVEDFTRSAALNSSQWGAYYARALVYMAQGQTYLALTDAGTVLASAAEPQLKQWAQQIKTQLGG
ncbi:MAG: nitroreductase family protein [Dehalococcoidia bacterium]|nr:nitroreductase family protein [Dehalococcoidia bacterium]